MRRAPPDINVNRLPPQLRMLVRVLGEAAAFKLVEACGGAYVIVPKRVTPDHQLLDVLGLQGFMALVDAYGGETLHLPKYDSVMRQVRHQRVHELIGKGYTIKEVALATNYTMRQVINIKQSADPIEHQAGLWDDVREEVVDVAPADEGLPTAHNPFGL